MTFLVILIALLIERFFDWSHLRKWTWYNTYQEILIQKLKEQPPAMILAAIIIPLLLAVLVLGLMINNSLYGVMKFLFMLFIFIYCLGPQNLWADTFSCINALSQQDAGFASEKLKNSFGVTLHDSPKSMQRDCFNQIFIEANRRIFAMMCWFIVFGPLGAVLYRSLSLSALTLKDSAPKVALQALTLESLLDWLPVRIFTFILGLGGHFAKVFPIWSQKALLGLDSNDQLLTECGTFSMLNGDKIETDENSLTLKNAVSLLDRSFIIALFIILVIDLVI